MAQAKKDTIVFKQTLSNARYKKLFIEAQANGETVQDLVRRLIQQHQDNGNKL